MNRSHDEEIRRLFDRAIELSGEARRSLLESARAGSAEIVADVESLLAFHERENAMLDVAPIAAGSAPLSSATGQPTSNPDAPSLPAQLGSYTLLSILGEGGMGVVYEALQASPQRPVAIKLIRPEVLSASIIRRFEHEAAALGMIDHPGIARVYEAGRALLNGDGSSMRAFIAMELVRGMPLVQHADRAKLSPRQRMLLLADVCDAVQAAHLRGVIHRDIKPGNILVGADGRPRIVDFGVARLADEAAAGTLVTRTGQVVGTLAYMSPEQAAGDPARVDSRSDIYSLGAVLFELLCGRAPIDVSQLSLHSALAAIQSAEPRIPREVRRSLGRDAEAIVLKALAKDPARRYQHASDLADDLRRLLDARPVTARPPTLAYQCSRFCRRNRELVAAAVVVAATVLIALVATSIALLRERDARADAVSSAQSAELARDEAIASAEAAKRNLARSEAVTGFLHTLLGGIRSEVARGRDTAVLRELLERSESSLDVLDDQPLASADARALLGDVFRDLGEFDRSETYYIGALELYRAHLGENHRPTATVMHNLGALYRGSLRRYDDAEPLLRQALAIYTALNGPDDLDSRRARSSLALLYLDVGRYADAEPILRELRDSDSRTLGPEHPDTLRAMHNHAGALSMLGRITEAHDLALRTFETRARVLGEDHPTTVLSGLFLSGMQRTLGRPDAALPLVQRSLSIRRAQHGELHPQTLIARLFLANTLRDLGRLEEAAGEADSLLADYRTVLGDSHIETLQARILVLELRVLLGRCEGAVDESARIIDAITALGDRFGLWATAAQQARGIALACEGDHAAAETVLRSVFDEFERTLTNSHRFTQRAAESLVWIYEREGRVEDAASWRRKLPHPDDRPQIEDAPEPSTSTER